MEGTKKWLAPHVKFCFGKFTNSAEGRKWCILGEDSTGSPALVLPNATMGISDPVKCWYKQANKEQSKLFSTINRQCFQTNVKNTASKWYECAHNPTTIFLNHLWLFTHSPRWGRLWGMLQCCGWSSTSPILHIAGFTWLLGVVSMGSWHDWAPSSYRMSTARIGCSVSSSMPSSLCRPQTRCFLCQRSLQQSGDTWRGPHWSHWHHSC